MRDEYIELTGIDRWIVAAGCGMAFGIWVLGVWVVVEILCGGLL